MTQADLNLVMSLINEQITSHQHNNLSAAKQDPHQLLGVPQAITAYPTGSLSTGGSAVLSTADNAILTALITSDVSMYTALQKLGILK